jgi:hypothetical protein
VVNPYFDTIRGQTDEWCDAVVYFCTSDVELCFPFFFLFFNYVNKLWAVKILTFRQFFFIIVRFFFFPIENFDFSKWCYIENSVSRLIWNVIFSDSVFQFEKKLWKLVQKFPRFFFVLLWKFVITEVLKKVFFGLDSWNLSENFQYFCVLFWK